MAKNQVSISTIRGMAKVLEMAHKVYPDSESDGEAFRRALAGWLADRESGGKNAKIDNLANDILQIRISVDMLAAEVKALNQTVREVCIERKRIK